MVISLQDNVHLVCCQLFHIFLIKVCYYERTNLKKSHLTSLSHQTPWIINLTNIKFYNNIIAYPLVVGLILKTLLKTLPLINAGFSKAFPYKKHYAMESLTHLQIFKSVFFSLGLELYCLNFI